MTRSLRFPKGFIWGTATSGHQIEGWNESSDWWAWERERHARDRPRSGRSVEYWDRYEDDHALMSKLGYPAFRLGVEWARIEPSPGKIDKHALQHYRKILGSLRSRDIKICLTLNHWVLPHWVVKQQDWLNPKTVDDIVRFTSLVVDTLGEFPDLWVTLNEPMMPAVAGNLLTHFPPQRGSFAAFRRVAAAQLEAHARMYQLIHEHRPSAPGGGPTRVGVAKAYPWIEPWGSKGLDGLYERAAVKIARLLAYDAWDRSVQTGRRHLVFGGDIVDGLRNSYDFCGINYYTRFSLKRASGKGTHCGIDEKQTPPGIRSTEMGWQVYPPGLTHTIQHVWERFRKPIIITENGIADRFDAMRPNYMLNHLARIHSAIAKGIPVEGYFHWSFMDNFEWREGFSKKFGLVAVDSIDPDLVRRPRRSAELYSEIVRANGITEAMAQVYAPHLVCELFREERA